MYAPEFRVCSFAENSKLSHEHSRLWVVWLMITPVSQFWFKNWCRAIQAAKLASNWTMVPVKCGEGTNRMMLCSSAVMFCYPQSVQVAFFLLFEIPGVSSRQERGNPFSRHPEALALRLDAKTKAVICRLGQVESRLWDLHCLRWEMMATKGDRLKQYHPRYFEWSIKKIRG